MLLYFEGQLCWVAIDFVFDFERVVDFRQFVFIREFHVYNGTNYLNDVSFIHKLWLTTQRHLRGGDLEQLRGNTGLTHLVVLQGQILDKLLSIIGSIFHRHHSSTMLRGARIQNHLENLKLNIVRQHNTEELFGFRLENITEHRIDILFGLSGLCSFRQIKAADRQERLHNRTLADRVDKM